MQPTSLTRSLSPVLSSGLPAAPRRIFRSLALACATLLFAPMTASAAPVTVPAGLNPGDHYRLVFVTSTTRDATSSNIADYNTFVNGVANAPASPITGLATWTAIGSAGSTGAQENTLTRPGIDVDCPVYNLAGELVASNYTTLWTVDIPYQGLIFLSHAINRTEDGSLSGNFAVWTGVHPFGFDDLTLRLGQPRAIRGASLARTRDWYGNQGEESTLHYHFYGMSGVLTVPVPEPSTMALACLAAVAVAVPMLQRHRKGRS